MADFLDELGSYLDTENVGIYDATKNRNIFTSIYPASPDNCIALLGTIGTTLTSSRDVPALQFPRFQVIVRNTDYDDASTTMQSVRDALHGQVGLALTSWRVLRLHAEQEGYPIGQDKQGRYEFSINFIAEYVAV